MLLGYSPPIPSFPTSGEVRSGFQSLGHTTPQIDSTFIEAILAEESPATIIEVGCFVGGMTRFLAKDCRKVFCVDTFEGPLENREIRHPAEHLRIFCQNLGDSTLSTVIPLWGPSHSWAHAWPARLKADMVVIDAGHEFPEICQDIHGWWPHLKDGGVMLLHDYFVLNTVNKALLWAFGEGYAKVARRDIQGGRVPIGGGHYLPSNFALIRK